MFHRFSAKILVGTAMLLVVGGVSLFGFPGSPARESEAQSENGLQRIDAEQAIFGASFVNPSIEVFGEVFIGQQSFVAGNTVLRAAPERRVIPDGAVITDGESLQQVLSGTPQTMPEAGGVDPHDFFIPETHEE